MARTTTITTVTAEVGDMTADQLADMYFKAGYRVNKIGYGAGQWEVVLPLQPSTRLYIEESK